MRELCLERSQGCELHLRLDDDVLRLAADEHPRGVDAPVILLEVGALVPTEFAQGSRNHFVGDEGDFVWGETRGEIRTRVVVPPVEPVCASVEGDVPAVRVVVEGNQLVFPLEESDLRRVLCGGGHVDVAPAATGEPGDADHHSQGKKEHQSARRTFHAFLLVLPRKYGAATLAISKRHVKQCNG